MQDIVFLLSSTLVDMVSSKRPAVAWSALLLLHSLMGWVVALAAAFVAVPHIRQDVGVHRAALAAFLAYMAVAIAWTYLRRRRAHAASVEREAGMRRRG